MLVDVDRCLTERRFGMWYREGPPAAWANPDHYTGYIPKEGEENETALAAIDP